MNFDQWVKKYIGKCTDFDNAYGVQCVDLIDCYIFECLGLHIGFYGNAKNWWLDRNKSKWLQTHFDFITPTHRHNEVKRGDICIRATGKYGHIFIIDHQTDTKITYYDQNHFGKGDAMTKRECEYNVFTVNGILRPKNQKFVCVIPKIKKGTYTLTGVRGCYKGAGAKTGRKLVKELTADGKKHAMSKNPNDEAYLNKGTKVDVTSTKTGTNNNIWAHIPSGWVCVFEAEKDKKYIK